jgi:hypothetical protein
MQCLHWESLSPSWSEFVKALFRDLEPLGHSQKREADGSLTAEIREAGEVSDERHWDRGAQRMSPGGAGTAPDRNALYLRVFPMRMP